MALVGGVPEWTRGVPNPGGRLGPEIGITSDVIRCNSVWRLGPESPEPGAWGCADQQRVARGKTFSCWHVEVPGAKTLRGRTLEVLLCYLCGREDGSRALSNGAAAVLCLKAHGWYRSPANAGKWQ